MVVRFGAQLAAGGSELQLTVGRGTCCRRVQRTPLRSKCNASMRDLAVKCGTYSGTRNGRPVMGLSSSAVKADAGRGAVGSSDIRHTEHTMIVTTGRRARTVHSSARSVCGRGRKADGQGDLGQSDRTQILRRGLSACTFWSMCPRPTSRYNPGSPTEGGYPEAQL